MACDRRACLMNKMKALLSAMDCEPCCEPSPCSPMCCQPMIEMYDPLPKPAIPLATPGPVTPLDPNVPVPHVASPCNPCGGACIPVVVPQPIPCIPLASPCPKQEQPCVPCNPPQIMVCYRRGRSRPSRGGQCCVDYQCFPAYFKTEPVFCGPCPLPCPPCGPIPQPTVGPCCPPPC